MTTKFFATALLAGALSAQTNPLQFEVASIRPVAPITAGAGQTVNAGVKIDKNQFRSSYLAMRDYLGIAFQMKLYQIEGPEWLAGERFDINATMPSIEEGKTLDGKDLASMMRGLLESRFQLKSHPAKKEFPVYALVQTKDGIQAKEAPLDAPERHVEVGGGGSAQGTFINLGRGSTFMMGSNRIEVKKFSMATLADTLARFVDRPVVDQTGLTSTYDITLEMTLEDFQALGIRAAMSSGVTLPPQVMKMLETASGDSFHAALAKVGLKLEAKKAPLDIVVIDSISKTPTEN